MRWHRLKWGKRGRAHCDLGRSYYMGDMNQEATARYRYPPIVEAVFELRPIEAVPLSKMQKASDWIIKKYNNRVIDNQVEVKVEPATRKVFFSDLPPVFRHNSLDQTEQCSISANSISWVRRAPYEGWEKFYGRIESELPDVLTATGITRFGRLGLRYVNRIDVPLTDGVYRNKDYSNFYIKVDDFLQTDATFEWKIIKQFPELSLFAMVFSGAVQPEIPKTSAFVFDIDVYDEVSVPSNIDSLLEKINVMRDLKNKIFEMGVTDRAKELYR